MISIRPTLVPAYFLLVMWAGCASSSGFYIEHAELARTISAPTRRADPADLAEWRSEPVRRLLSGHYVKQGESLVVLIRRFDSGDFFATDTQVFEKLSIELPAEPLGKVVPVNAEGVKLYYSRGSSAFAKSGYGAYGTEGWGTVVIERCSESKLRAKLDMDIKVQSAREDVLLQGETVRIHGSYTLDRITLDDITPWLGAPGALDDETTP